MRCCVPFCKTTVEIVSETKEITFHEFPREMHLRAAWLRALGKQDALLPASAVVCSQHFLNDEIYVTENGSSQIRTGAIPATVLICLICLDTRNTLLLMSEHKLEQAYHDLVGHLPCGRGRLKHTLCVQCAQRLVDFSTFRDESLRARCLMTELLHSHEVITRRHVALLSRYKRPQPSDIDIEPDTAPDATATVAAATTTVTAATATDATDVAVAVKQEVEHWEDVDTAAYNADSIATVVRPLRDHCKALEDTPAAAEAATETQAPMKREYVHTVKQEVEHWEDVDTAAYNADSIATVVRPLREHCKALEDMPAAAEAATETQAPMKREYVHTVKQEVEHWKDVDTAAYNADSIATVVRPLREHCKALEDTPAAAEAATETQAPMKREYVHTVKQEVEHWEDVDTAAYNADSIATVVRPLREHCKALEDTPAAAEAATETQAAMKREYVHTVKQEVEHWEDVDTAAYNADSIATVVRPLREHCKALEDTPAAAEAATETQAPMKREHSCEPESSEDCYQALVAPLLLVTNPGNEEHPNLLSEDWDISSFENNANVYEDPRKSQDAELTSKESLAKIDDSIDYRTRRDDRLPNEHRKHSQDILLGNNTDRSQYICDVGQTIFQRKVSLVSNIRAHAFAKTLSCELKECKLNQNHPLSSHNTMQTGQDFACKLCKYKCKVRSRLARHMKTHTGEKPFSCELCKYKFTESSSLVSHMRTHTGEKPFACELCKYRCTVSSSLVNHMRTHTGEKPFGCELCEYKCKFKSQLVSHIRNHTGEMPFGCELCKYKCAVKSYLVMHMRTHTGEKPFTCELCNYKCTSKSHLVSHMRTHTGEKPFGCELCKYKCAVKNNLVKHMKTHTGEKPFSCELCKYKCTESRSLVRHMRTHTGEKPFISKLCI